MNRIAGIPGQEELTLFERSRAGRSDGNNKVVAPPPGALAGIPARHLRRTAPMLPELNEREVVQHYVTLSQQNYSIDGGFYPLGSCTMKYNPKVNEWAARLPGFAQLHPWSPDDLAQGALQLMRELEQLLCEISGMQAVSLQPAAGAQGELTALAMFRAYHLANGEGGREEVVVSDSSHGTNPATASMVGYRTVTVPSGRRGTVEVQALREVLGPKTAAVMLTNPSTLGLFEENVIGLLEAIHGAGALAYMDGANLNAIMGRFRPGAVGFDAMHFNLHKTFSTPHGGGGPGSGPVGVAERLVPFLPEPRVVQTDDEPLRLERPGERPRSIGRMRSFHGNVGVLVRAYAYIRAHGGRGLEEISNDAVLAANYVKARLSGAFEFPYDRRCFHEFVASARRIKADTGVTTLDIAKRLIDYGFHPPTIYFPLIVEEALLIEPTETESIETLDAFADALLEIVAEAYETPELVRAAPTTTLLRRLDEARAARMPDLRWRPVDGGPGSGRPCRNPPRRKQEGAVPVGDAMFEPEHAEQRR